MRYKDRIQCAGHELVSAVRAEAMKEAPNWGGEYYAMHIRRGDFQYKVRIIVCSILSANIQLREWMADKHMFAF